MSWNDHPWAGVFPATLCAFQEDEAIDEEGLCSHFLELASVEGVKGLVCNGHTGEIMALRAEERAQVTRILAETIAASGSRLKAISGVSAEGSLAGIDDAQAAKESGANAILLMPPHHWLRFGRSVDEAIGYVADVAQDADIPIILHQYPAWTKATYSLAEMLEIVKIPQVKCIKMGTRDMARWLYDYEQIKTAAPHISIATCHDEFLLPTLLEAADGALVGFASFAPKLIVELVHAALDGDLARAKRMQQTVAHLARIIYEFGEPSSGAHQRMKVASWLMGKFPSPHVRRPVRPLSPSTIEGIRTRLEAIGYLCPTPVEFSKQTFTKRSLRRQPSNVPAKSL